MGFNVTKIEISTLINEIKSSESFSGIIPISDLYNKILIKFSLSDSQLQILPFQNLLLELEKDNIIYLEPINDPSRLSIEEMAFTINDKIRGTLGYIGCW